jgi:filamentous hemagglutinin family protein
MNKINQVSNFLFVIFLFLQAIPVKAQIVPDNTLDTKVNQLNNVSEITGGQTRGNNLFHSFEGFSVGRGNEAFFNNAESISNIFSRVTGGSTSDIDGVISANGSANLFLVNPAGIVFGQNVRLDINGSFAATTADEIKFPDANFSAVDTDTVNLSVNFPIGLGLGSQPKNISIKGSQNNAVLEVPSFRIVPNFIDSLKVDPGKNISLIGGNINFDGGGILAPGGRIDLISLKADQQIDFTKLGDWFTVDNDNTLQYSDISLNNAAYLDVSDEVAGNIILRGQDIYINDGSVVLANTSLPTNNSIDISASGLLELKGSSGQEDINLTSLGEINDIVRESRSGTNKIEGRGNYYSISLIAADVLSGSDGVGNDINISANKINVIDGAEIRTVNFSPSTTRIAGGDIQIISQDLKVEGTNVSDNLLPSFITSTNGISKFGNTGNINISSGTIRILRGAGIKVDAFGFGDIGSLSIEADYLVIRGFRKSRFDSQSPLLNRSGLITSASNEGIDAEKSGLINIDVNTLEILEGGGIGSNSFGRNSAGEINIKAKKINLVGLSNNVDSVPTSISATVLRDSNITIPSTINENSSEAGIIRLDTDQLQILEGASIEANSNSGNSGSIVINAKNIEFDGTRKTDGEFTGGLSTSTAPQANGIGGDILINTDTLKIFDGSIIRAISLGSGDAGNIDINAEEIEISGVDRFAEDPVATERVSKINTGSLNTNGGNLTIKSRSVKLDDFGQIQATSVTGDRGGNIVVDTNSLSLFNQSNITASAGGQGNGGNVTIDAEVLVGLDNSDITANAIAGMGGNIDLSSDYIFGLESRNELTSFSDITASSELGIDGTVTVNSPDTNLIEEILVAAKDFGYIIETPIPGSSCLNKQQERIQLVDLGEGIAESPYDPLFDDEDLVEPSSSPVRQTDSNISYDWHPGDPIIEANAVRTLPNGDKYFVAVKSQQPHELPPALCSKAE